MERLRRPELIETQARLVAALVYLHAWKTGSEAKAGVRMWMGLYDYKRPHFSLGGKPSAVIYWQRTEVTKPDQQVQRVA